MIVSVASTIDSKLSLVAVVPDTWCVSIVPFWLHAHCLLTHTRANLLPSGICWRVGCRCRLLRMFQVYVRIESGWLSCNSFGWLFDKVGLLLGMESQTILAAGFATLVIVLEVCVGGGNQKLVSVVREDALSVVRECRSWAFLVN